MLTACRPEQEAGLPAFDGQRAYEEVVQLVSDYTPRDAGTPGARAAAEHLHRRLSGFGIDTRIDTFSDRTPEGEKTFHNVTGQIPGRSDRWIILASHFDTMPGIENFQGANDSGSSTGVLLEAARVIRAFNRTPETGILFAFFDGEEGIAGYVPGDGLHGSRHMAAELIESGMAEKVDGMILLDMVGDRDLHFIIPSNSSPALAKQLLDAARRAGHRERFSLSPPLAITDDHVPFLQAGIPAVDIIDFSYGSKQGLNDYWHTEMDNLDHISAESLGITGGVLLKLVEQMAFGVAAD
jgi:Zn-dependent M28 family amino/carboxypeptidase